MAQPTKTWISRWGGRGFTKADYDELVEIQHNRCPICRVVLDDIDKTAVDHDHETGFVRGVLCPNCNTGLGMLKDNLDNLRRAVDYLEEAERVQANNTQEQLAFQRLAERERRRTPYRPAPGPRATLPASGYGAVGTDPPNGHGPQSGKQVLS